MANAVPQGTQRVPHTLPLWNYPKTKIGMVFLVPNSIGSVYGPSELLKHVCIRSRLRVQGFGFRFFFKAPF